MTRRRIGTVAAAPAAALLAWAAIRLIGVDLVADGRTVGPADVVVAAVAGALAAWLVVGLLERRSRRPRQWWPFVGSTALSVSVIGPSWLADGAGAVGLIVLHFVVGIVVILGFARTLPLAGVRHAAR